MGPWTRARQKRKLFTPSAVSTSAIRILDPTATADNRGVDERHPSPRPPQNQSHKKKTKTRYSMIHNAITRHSQNRLFLFCFLIFFFHLKHCSELGPEPSSIARAVRPPQETFPTEQYGAPCHLAARVCEHETFGQPQCYEPVSWRQGRPNQT